MKLRSIYASSILATLTACNGYELGLIEEYTVKDPPVTDSDDVRGPACYAMDFTQPDEDRVKNVDLLFVVDTSGSLNEERAKIASQIDAYISKLPTDSNIHIAVMMGHGPESQWMGRFWSNGSKIKVLDVTTLGLEKTRAELVNRLKNSDDDAYTDGGEALFVSLFHGIRGERLAESKALGFFRDDAALAVVFVSDENEICFEYPAGVKRVRDAETFQNMPVETYAYKNYCKVTPTGGTVAENLSYKLMYSELKALKGEQPLLIASMVYTDPSNYPKVGENEYGYGYIEIVQESNGGLVNLASTDYSAGLGLIGDLTAVRLNLITDFKLIHSNVNPATIKVKIDELDALFTYSAAINTVVLTEPGDARSKINISYCVKEGDGEIDDGDDGDGDDGDDSDDDDGVDVGDDDAPK